MPLRRLLFPFSVLFGLITYIRNSLYDAGILRSEQFSIPVICIGNLSTGGTGKSPHTAYLINLLRSKFKVAVLSRGYGRSGSGFRIVSSQDTFHEVGDEPLQYFQKFDDIIVAVDEKRPRGIRKILEMFPETDVVLLDDAFQHRKAKAGMNILLTTYSQPFFNDRLLPLGNLREARAGAKRANIVVFTKIPDKLSEESKMIAIVRLFRYTDAPYFFSGIQYGNIVSLQQPAERLNKAMLKGKHVLVVTGIANSDPLLLMLEKISRKVTSMKFGDHHDFSTGDLQKLRDLFNNIESDDKVIVTTEKDAMRLFHPDKIKLLQDLPVYYQEISTLIENSKKFDKLILDYVKATKGNS